MKRVLVLNYEFPPLGGVGAGNATFYLLKEFARFDDLRIILTNFCVIIIDKKIKIVYDFINK